MSRDHWTFRKFARVVTTFVAFVALMSSVLTVVFVGTASAATTTLTPVGSFVTAGSAGLTTASATLVNPGDVLAIWVQATTQSTSGHVTGIVSSGTGATGTAVNAIAYTTVDHLGNDDEIWYAPVTTAGAVTLTFTWSGTPPLGNIEYSTQEFQPAATATYSADTTGHLEVSAASTTVGFPTLTPAGANELYLGYNSNNTSGFYGAPTTSGYTPESGATGDAIIFDAAAPSGAQTPSTTATTTPTVQSAIGAMIIATAATGNTVTFNGNTSTSGATAPETASAPTALTLNGFIKTGDVFTGWNTIAGGGGTAYANGATYPFSASITLYAQWATAFTVTFNGNTNTGGATAAETAGAPTALTLNGFTKTGDVFTGWNTIAGGGGTAYANGATYPFSASITLYAQWATPFTVTFNGNTNTGGATAAETAGAPTALTLNGFTKTGYNFAGWNTIAGGGGTAYTDGATYPFSASTTLYAQWTVAGGGGGGGGGTTLNTLTVTAGSQSITVGGSVTASSTVSGLTSPDTGTVSSATYTYVGSGTTTYASSTTAPTAAGTYSVTPSAATVAITPSADAANYSTTYTYVGGALTIAAAVVVVPPVVGPHATRVVGQAFVGKSRTLTIVGTNFTANPGIKSNQSGAVVRVRSKSANRIVLLITVRKGVRPGTHQFTITASGKTCRIGYITR